MNIQGHQLAAMWDRAIVEPEGAANFLAAKQQR
jgi:hypothetical protein